MTTPSLEGYYMPPEWERHEATWLAWPHHTMHWAGVLKQIQDTYLTIIEALVPGENIYVLVPNERELDGARARLRDHSIPEKRIKLLIVPTTDIWMRDYAPLFVCRRESDEKAYVRWRFNAWGGKYDDHLKDDEVVPRLAKYLPFPRFETEHVLEGGSIDLDGKGLCLTTEQCLLNPNRNPQLNRDQIETMLKDNLGLKRILWLQDGLEGDDTDGHIDDVARFLRDGVVAIAEEKDANEKNFSILKKNKSLLNKFQNEGLLTEEPLILPMPKPIYDEGERRPASFVNFYIANEVVLVPQFNDPSDAQVIAILKDQFPGRKIHGIDCQELILGGGSLHCVTQQEPQSTLKP